MKTSNEILTEKIITYLNYFLTHTNCSSHFEIEVKYDPEHDEKPIGTIKIDGAIAAENIILPDPYNK